MVESSIPSLYVAKRFNTYADVFLALGLAQTTVYALRDTKQLTQMQLVDQGTHYQLRFKKPIKLDSLPQIQPFDPFPIVFGQKTDISKIPETASRFDAVEAGNRRKLYRDYLFQSRGKSEWTEEVPPPPDPSTQNGIILTSMRHDRNHNELWYQGNQIKEHYGYLIAAMMQVFSQPIHAGLNAEPQKVAKLFKQATGVTLPDQASAVKVFLPTAVQGVNRIKADGNKTDAQKCDWLILWLIACGLFYFGVSERVKIAERVFDWRVVALSPRDIRFDDYKQVLHDLRVTNPPGGGHGIARFDAELVLRFCQQLLKQHVALAIDRPEDDLELYQPPNRFISGFVGTHFGQKGQVYGVKDLFNLGLPGWIQPDNYQDIEDYQEVLKEHLAVVQSLSAEDGQGELLNAYRDAMTSPELRQFFQFQVSYGDYAVRCLANPKARSPRLFSLTGLNTMTKKDIDFTKITRDPSFLRIAKAINQSTVYAGEIATKTGTTKLDWQRNYGLGQRLSGQAGSKTDFLREVADFLGKYQQENLRISEQLQKQGQTLKRIWTTKEDLDRLVELVNEFDTVLVANLLVAYGYARWTKAKDEPDPIDAPDNVTNTTEDNLEETGEVDGE